MKFRFLILSLFILIFTACGDVPSHRMNSSKEDSKQETNSGDVRKSYYKNGQVKNSITFKDDEKNGPATMYYEHGQVYKEFNYKNDKKDGLVKFYRESGRLYRSTNYKRDKKHGVEKVFYPNKDLKSKISYNKGFPGNDLVEFAAYGKKRNEKYKLTAEKDGKKFTISLNKNSEKATFYAGKLWKGKFLHEDLITISNQNGTGYLNLRPFYDKKTIDLIAVIKSRFKNPIILHKTFNL